MTERAARARDRLARQRLDAGLRRRRPPTPTRASPRPPPSAPRSRPSGRTRPGVPIDAMLFGGRRSTVVPLVHEAFDWEHGVFLGRDHVLGDDRGRGRRRSGKLRFDPFAMLPFCGYHMARLLRPLARDRPAGDAAKLPQDLLRQLVPQGRGRPLPVAGLRREQPRAGVDLPPLRRQGGGGRDADRASCPRRATSTPTGLDVSERTWPSC